MNDLPAVYTVILNWNGLDDTRECLNSLRSVSYPNNRVVVVDNASQQDEAAAIESEFGDFVHVLRSETNRGFAGGVNVGIRYALKRGADYVLLLNNDTVVHPGFLSALVEAAEALRDVAAVCPKVYFHHRPDVIYSTGGRVSLWKGVARQIGRGQIDRGQFDEIDVRDYADGVCMLVPRRALERVGLFDEEYFLYWEETDWCVRARREGLVSYYVPPARIWHKAERSRSPDARFHYLYRRNALLFVRKRGGALRLASALLMHLFVYAPAYFLRHPTHVSRALAELRALFWHAGNQPAGAAVTVNEDSL